MSESNVGKVECEVYSRPVGFLRPVSWWNKGKQAEWKERKTYKMAKAVTRAYGTPLERGEHGGVAPGTVQEEADDWAANDPPAWAEVAGR